ncbi:MAG: DUF1328 domain-containing protein [Propionivibrio sp.]
MLTKTMVAGAHWQQELSAGANRREADFFALFTDTPGVITMIKLAIFFFVVSLITGWLGFTNVSEGTAGIAKILFYIAVVIFLIVLIFGVLLGTLVF